MASTEISKHGGALQGLRVVELGDGTAAPLAAKLLGDFGADVVKVESPSGDSTRTRGPFPDDIPGPEQSGLFCYLNTSKRGIMLDPANADDRAELDQLLARSDIFLVDLGAEKRKKWGIDIKALRLSHPALVIVDISPFGNSDAYAGWRGSELTAYAMSGLAYSTPGFPDAAADLVGEPPLRANCFVAESVAGVVGATAAISGIHARRQSGDGCLAEVSEQAALACMQQRHINEASYWPGHRHVREFSPATIGRMPNFYLQCKDGYAAVPAPLESHWHRLVDAMGRPEWALQEKFSTAANRGMNGKELVRLITQWTMTLTGAELYAIALKYELLIFPFYTVSQMIESDHVKARQSLAPLPLGTDCKMPGAPVNLTGSPWAVSRPAPKLGEHTAEIRGELHDAASATRAAVSPHAPTRPLAGVKVLDFGQFIAVPFCTLWLGWLGAEVISIESRKRMTSRNAPPFAEGHVGDPNGSGYYNLLYSSKKSCTVDLSTEAGRETIRQLASTADVVVDNFTTGVMDKLGLGYERLSELNPRLIALSSGVFGRSGPMKNARGMHSAANLFSGVAEVTGYRGGGPRILGGALPDPLAGIYACLAILIALQNREKTGKGQFIDVAMYEAFITLIPEAVIDVTLNKRQPVRIGNRDAQRAPHDIYQGLEDDSWLAISVEDDVAWRALCDVIGRPDLQADSRFSTLAARQANADELDEIVAAWVRSISVEQGAAALQARGVSAAPALRTEQLMEDPAMRGMGFIIETDHPVVGRRRQIGLPWRTDSSTPSYHRAPLLGEHTRDVLLAVPGIDENMLAKLEAEGVLN